MCVAGESSIILSVHDVTTPNTALQVRTSYVPQEILWGYRFEHKCVAYDKAMNKYAVSYTAINSFIPDRTPRWVAVNVDTGAVCKHSRSFTVLSTKVPSRGL